MRGFILLILLQHTDAIRLRSSWSSEESEDESGVDSIVAATTSIPEGYHNFSNVYECINIWETKFKENGWGNSSKAQITGGLLTPDQLRYCIGCQKIRLDCRARLWTTANDIGRYADADTNIDDVFNWSKEYIELHCGYGSGSEPLSTCSEASSAIMCALDEIPETFTKLCELHKELITTTTTTGPICPDEWLERPWLTPYGCPPPPGCSTTSTTTAPK